MLLRIAKRLHQEAAMTTIPRITPVEAPYPPEVGEQLQRMMPPGVAPIGLFRTFVRNLPMATAMHGWGSYELSRQLSVPMRAREIVIDRTCARCGCEYEWGVHVHFFAERVGFTAEQTASIVHGGAADPCWTEPSERLLVELVDQLHDHADVDDELWDRLRRYYTDDQLMDLVLLCGWYHAISFVARAARVVHEPGAPRFGDAPRRDV
jgi:alkylhydroperoxidase family enzyme